MADLLNISASSTSGQGLTGIAPQQFDLKRYSSILLIPKDQGFTAAERASITAFLRALQTRTTVDDRTVRMFPIHGITGIANSNTAPTEYTSGFGVKETIADGSYFTTLTFRDGGLLRHANLNEFNGEDYDIMLVDSYGKFLGRVDSAGLFCGLTGKFTVIPYDLPDDSNPSLYKATISFTDTKQLNQLSQIGFMDCDNQFNFATSVPGIVGLVLDARAATAAKTINVGIKTVDGGVDMYDTYDDEFAYATLFRVVKTSDWTTEVTINSVTKNAGKYWILALAAYTGEVAVYLEGPTTLAGKNIGGAPAMSYEAVDPLIVTLPAP